MCAARILVADDHEVVRQGLRTLLQEQAQWTVVAEAKDGREAVTKAGELKPNVAVIDISMPSLNGLDATKQMLKANPDLKVLILTMHDSEQIIESVLSAGAKGYILKSDASRELVAAVEALLAGKTFFTEKAAQIVLDGYMGKRPTAGNGESNLLSAREREVVQLLAEGKSSKEVASLLDLSTKTVETHRTNIMRKLSCHSVSELVRYAVRNHLVEA